MHDLVLSKHIRYIQPNTKYGKGTVIEYSHTATNKGRNAYYSCACDCGSINKVSGSSLKRGITTQLAEVINEGICIF